MTRQLVDPDTKLPIEVVEPGSPGDPFKGASAAPPSADVSSEGTPQEKQTQTGDEKPATSETASVATETPALVPEAPVLPVQTGVVEVIPPQGQAPVAVETATPAGEAKPAEVESAKAEPITEDAAKVLQTAIKTQVDDALRGQQSTYDQRAAKLEKSMQDAQEQNKGLTSQIRDLEMRDLTDEEKAKVQATYAQKDERAELDTYRGELAVVNSSLYVQALMLDFEPFGVTKEQLEGLKTPEEMDVFCLEAKATSLEKKLAEIPEVKAEVPATETPETKEPPKVTAEAVAQVPAAAQVGTDMGSPGAATDATKFSEETTPEALRDNLKAAGWSTVRFRG